jgi:hypothetical protein
MAKHLRKERRWTATNEVFHEICKILHPSSEVLEQLLLTEYETLQTQVRHDEIIAWCYKIRTIFIKARALIAT